MDYLQQGTPDFRRANLALFAGGFVTFAILYSTQPLLPVYTREFHVSPTVASLSLSVSTATLAVFMLIAGSLSEALGRKRVMGVTLFISSVVAVLTGCSPNFRALLLLRVVQGLFLAGLPAIAMAYLSEEVAPKSVGLAMGLYISGNSVGGMAGRIFTGILTDMFSWRVAMGSIGVLSILCSLLFVWLLPPSRHFQAQPLRLDQLGASMWHHLQDTGLLRLYGIGFLLMGGFVSLYNYISYQLTAAPYHLSQTIVGFIFIVYLTGTFSSTWMGNLADQKGRKKTLWAAISLMLAGAILTLAVPLVIKLVGIAVFTFGFFGAHSIASSWVGKRANAEKAQASSLYLFFYYVGSSIGGSAGGELWSGFGWIGVVSMITVFLLVAVVFSLRIPAVQREALRS